MDLLLGSKPLAPGIRFHPTDEELFMHYLKRKVMGKSLRPQMISEVDVYKFAPWDLPDKSFLKNRDLNWFFFCPRSNKYPNGGRSNRATEYGYWKSTGNDRTVQSNQRPVGKIKTLIFHRGKPPNGDRTDWVMHEYKLEDKLLADMGVAQDAFVICKVYKKSGLGPKNGEHYGAPFVEEDWASDDEDENNPILVMHPEGSGLADNQNTSILSCAVDTQNVATVWTPSTAEQLVPAENEQLNPNVTEEDELDRLLAMFTEDDDALVNGRNETLDIDFFDGLEDLDDGFYSKRVEYDWSELLANDGDCYLEVDDLID